MNKTKFLNLKELVIVLLLACVETAIALVTTMPFAANLQLVYFLAPGLAGLINGIIYVLLVKKCPKIGTQFIIPMVYGLYFLFTGSVYVFAFFAILAVVNELIMLGGYVAMGMDAASADAAIASLEGFWLAPQNIAIALAAAAALSIAGYGLGMKMLGKHFKPAGVA